MKYILFILYIIIEAFVEMIFLRRLSNDDTISGEDKDRLFIRFAAFSAFWPITVPTALIAENLIGYTSCDEHNDEGDCG